MKLKLLVVVLPLLVPAPLVAADLLVWEHQAVSQRDIDAYEWRYYLCGATKGTVLKGVVCKETEVEHVYTCSTARPRVVGWIRLTGKRPGLASTREAARSFTEGAPCDHHV